MTANIIALTLTAVISIFVPLIILGVMLIKNSSERKKISLLFFAGILVYLAMEWGVKEHGLQYLFNHTPFASFTASHYISYLLIVALASAVFTVIPEVLVITFVCKKKLSLVCSVAFALGYAMLEAAMRVGYHSILTIIELMKDASQKLGVSTLELFLSGYERLLIMIIRVSLVALLVYFIQQKRAVLGVILKVICHTMASFLPGFFIAFSLPVYFEVYDRSVALILVYVVLTAMAFTFGVILNSIKYSFQDK